MDWQDLLLSIDFYLPYFSLFLFLLSLLLIILFFVQRGKVNRLARKFEELMGKGENISLEAHLLAISRELNRLNSDFLNLSAKTEKMEQRLKKSIQKVGVVRFNAFEDVGSALSFAVAFLDEEDNGVVLTGIYGRDSVHTFAKPIINGKSSYRLSAEEEEALRRATEKQENQVFAS